MIELPATQPRQPKMDPNAPDYAAVAASLERLDSPLPPAELHGTLTGLLCADTEAPAEVWQQHLFPQDNTGDLLAEEAMATLTALYAATQGELNDPNFEFELLLPDDDTPLDDRVYSLSEWCQGFLLGLSLGGITDFAPLPQDAREIAQDLTEIARASNSYNLEGGEEDENAYAELVEYLRVGVLLINEELQPSQAPPLTDTIH